MTVRSIGQAVSELVAEFGGNHDSDYVTHMVTTALGLGTDSTSTLDLKIASSALKEMREAFSMFDPYPTMLSSHAGDDDAKGLRRVPMTLRRSRPLSHPP